jgi:hypothetical protein
MFAWNLKTKLIFFSGIGLVLLMFGQLFQGRYSINEIYESGNIWPVKSSGFPRALFHEQLEHSKVSFERGLF